MNPVTQSLLKYIQNPELAQFIACWDALEALVIYAFRNQKTTPEDQREYRHIRSCIQRHYPVWQYRLHPLWQKTKVAGQSLQQDPFVGLMQPEHISEFTEHWSLVQMLPAARETINQLMLEMIEA